MANILTTAKPWKCTHIIYRKLNFFACFYSCILYFLSRCQVYIYLALDEMFSLLLKIFSPFSSYSFWLLMFSWCALAAATPSAQSLFAANSRITVSLSFEHEQHDKYYIWVLARNVRPCHNEDTALSVHILMAFHRLERSSAQAKLGAGSDSRVSSNDTNVIEFTLAHWLFPSGHRIRIISTFCAPYSVTLHWSFQLNIFKSPKPGVMARYRKHTTLSVTSRGQERQSATPKILQCCLEN